MVRPKRDMTYIQTTTSLFITNITITMTNLNKHTYIYTYNIYICRYLYIHVFFIKNHHLHNSYPKRKKSGRIIFLSLCNVATSLLKPAEVAIGSAFRYGILVHQGCSILTTGYRSLHGHFGPTTKTTGKQKHGKMVERKKWWKELL